MVEVHKALTPELQYLFDAAYIGGPGCGERSKPGVSGGEIHYVAWFRPWDELDMMASQQSNCETGYPDDSEASVAEAMKQYIQLIKSRGDLGNGNSS